jgi:hypothetical protein
MDFGIVYKIFQVNDPTQFYIGSTFKTLEDRYAWHHYCCRYDTVKNSKLYRLVRKIGDWSYFQIEELESFEKISRLDLLKEEQKYIDELKPTLNINNAVAKLKTISIRKTYDINDNNLFSNYIKEANAHPNEHLKN